MNKWTEILKKMPNWYSYIIGSYNGFVTKKLNIYKKEHKL